MPRKEKANSKSADLKECVTVAFAEDMELAKQYQELLRDNGIDAQIKRQPEMAESGFSDIAIVVPEESLDDAHTLVSEKASYNDFFDMVFNDQDYDRFDYSEFETDEDDDIY